MDAFFSDLPGTYIDCVAHFYGSVEMCFFFGCGKARSDMNRISKEECICCLQQKAEELGRLPKKSDFDVETVNGIKSFFGPWPRALEAAGIKKPDPLRMQRRREKRRRARVNQIRFRKEHPRRKIEEKGEQ